MKIHRISFFISILLTSIISTSCVNIKEVQCTGISGFKLNKISTEGINADVKVKIKNSNSFSFKIFKSEVEVSYAGIKIGTAKLLKSVKIKAESEDVYTCRLENEFKHLKLDDIVKLLESFNRKGNIEIKGNVKVGKGFMKKTVPVSIDGKVDVEG